MSALNTERALMQLRSQHGPQNYDTICGVQRALWRYIDQLPEPQRSEAETLLADAYVMGSKLYTALLKELGQKWDTKLQEVTPK
jgi:hypothetical protein